MGMLQAWPSLLLLGRRKRCYLVAKGLQSLCLFQTRCVAQKVGVGLAEGSDIHVKQTWAEAAFHKFDRISVFWFVPFSDSTNY